MNLEELVCKLNAALGAGVPSDTIITLENQMGATGISEVTFAASSGVTLVLNSDFHFGPIGA